jgi:myo-inositol catabolism protein IolC
MNDSEHTNQHSELFILAMDHRDSLQRDLYGIEGQPTDEQIKKISAGKQLIFEGLVAAIHEGVDPMNVGVLVDERYGAMVARQARAAGLDLAMPIERSGQKLFTLEYGTLETGEWLEHVNAFNPDQVKVLVRDNPGHPASDRHSQLQSLAQVSAALKERNRTFLFELLVPATDAQLATVDGDALRYDTELRPELTMRVMRDMQDAGVNPQVWKIEGLETADAAAEIVGTARRDGRADVRCIVLGRDAPADRLDHWLDIAAATDGFFGFAIGRSIWEQPLADELAGKISSSELVSQVTANYVHYVSAYTAARAQRVQPAGRHADTDVPESAD